MTVASAVSRRVATAAASCAAALPLFLFAAPPPAAADPCPDVDLVFARGTNEAPGIGRVGQALVGTLQSQLGGRTLGVYPVNYPATYDFLATADGASDATAYIEGMAQRCPSTSIVLSGYSQGAAVVDMLVGIPPLGERVGDVGSAPPLPPSLAQNVAAIAAFGNPATKFGNPVSAAGGPFAGKGIDMCAKGDPICSSGRNPFAHTSYENTDMPRFAAGFVAERV
jgi:cutinase